MQKHIKTFFTMAITAYSLLAQDSVQLPISEQLLHFQPGFSTVQKDGTTLKSREVKELFKESPDALSLYKKGRRQHISGGVLSVLGFAMVLPALTGDSNNGSNITPWIGAAAFTGGIILTVNGSDNIERSVDIYNMKSVQVSFTGSGFVVMF